MSRLELQFSEVAVDMLPEAIITRSKSIVDPHDDIWEWTDGPFVGRMDFERLNRKFALYVPWLKLCLVPFVKGYSSSHPVNLFGAFTHFVNVLGDAPTEGFTAQHISNYVAKLAAGDIGRIGHLSVLLQKWVLAITEN